jgi:hypothetical protein
MNAVSSAVTILNLMLFKCLVFVLHVQVRVMTQWMHVIIAVKKSAMKSNVTARINKNWGKSSGFPFCMDEEVLVHCRVSKSVCSLSLKSLVYAA